ncbi:hypothetical protein [Anaeromicropila herbilytica]|uniref:Uncharacterized protein n=1 Tax=Anaeromicropila herbilytica TaxID=2785025 RepID=A0A7R7ICB2_9FIRM|nr:hypothetical protein [Anaeromicropila herbilytica]BCN30412.1 hypothetical protein bsdtb5_17070 [Anaeromicropila herbilytica]
MFFGNSTDKLIRYMDKKYAEKFEYVSPYGGKLGSKTTKILVKSDKFPEETILVQRTKEKDGDYVYRDNYTAFLLRGELRSLLTDITGYVFESSEYKLFYNVTLNALPENYDNNTSMEEYTSNGNSLIDFTIVLNSNVDESRKEQYVEKLGKELEKNHIVSSFSIYFANDNHTFDMLSYKNINDFLMKSDWYSQRGIFTYSNSYQLLSGEWR